MAQLLFFSLGITFGYGARIIGGEEIPPGSLKNLAYLKSSLGTCSATLHRVEDHVP